MTIFNKIDFSPLKKVSQRKPRSLKGHRKIPQSFARDAQCQKSSNLIYFHNQKAKQLIRNLGHGSCHIDPPNYLKFFSGLQIGST